MPGLKRRATQALYAFCRLSDVIVDCPNLSQSTPEQIRARLEGWRQQILTGNNSARSDQTSLEQTVSLAWADARRTFQIPRGYVDQLIDGLALDIDCVRYETFGDLSRYCYGVACTVGLMSMHINGYTSREAVPYAIRLGVALQLTNILRDVGEDWRNGRLYLPREELAAFGLDEGFIAEGRVDWRWRSFMRFQIDRARHLYEESLLGFAYLHRDGRFAIAAAGELYRAISERIESIDYDVFSHRAVVKHWGKLSRLPGIWLRSMFAGLALPKVLLFQWVKRDLPFART